MRVSNFLLQLYCHGGIEYEVDAMYEILADGSCQFRVHWKCHEGLSWLDQAELSNRTDLIKCLLQGA